MLLYSSTEQTNPSALVYPTPLTSPEESHGAKQKQQAEPIDGVLGGTPRQGGE